MRRCRRRRRPRGLSQIIPPPSPPGNQTISPPPPSSRYAQAAELYEGIDAHSQAINVYVEGGMWEQARSLARSAAPQLARRIEEMYKRHLSTSGQASIAPTCVAWTDTREVT